MELTLTSSPASASCTSTWSGYESGYNEVRYTTPTQVGDSVVIALPADLAGAAFESARLSYRASSAAGTKSVRYDGSGVAVTDANLLERLRSGESEIALRFTFRASGGTGGEGSHSATCYFTDVTLTVGYVPAGGISGETAAGGHTVRYFCAATSLAPGERAEMSIVTDAAVTAAKLYLGRGVYECALTGGRGAFGLSLSQDEIDAMTQRVNCAYLHFMLTDASGDVSSPTLDSGMTLIKQRLAPAVSVSFTDENGYDSLFGNFVVGQSVLKAVISAVPDTDADAGIGTGERTFTLNGTEFSAAAGEIALGSVTQSGTVPWTASVTDTYGVTGTASGTITLLPYAAPGVTVFEVQRCSTAYDGSGQPVLAPDDGSPFTWMTLRGAVASVAGANEWSADLTVTGGGHTHTLTGILSGADGEELNVTRDTSLTEDLTLDVTCSYSVCLTVTDVFGTYRFTCPDVPAGGGILNIEKTGVAVGRRSAGTRVRPLFEVGYDTVFYGDIEFAGSDTLWQDVTFLNGCSAYDAADPVRVRRKNGVCYVKGTFKLGSTLNNGGSRDILRLPAGFRPASESVFWAGKLNGMMTVIGTDGTVSLVNRSGTTVDAGLERVMNAVYLPD